MPRRTAVDPISALRHSGFLIYLLGGLISNSGSQMRIVAAQWEITIRESDLRQQALGLGYIGLALVLPVLLFALPAGAAADRFSRRWLIVIAQLGLAVCGIGLAWLPGQDLDRVFMVMGYFFCLSSAFALAKFVRDCEAADSGAAPRDTPLWSGVVWGGFTLAMALTGWGLLRMQVNPTYKAFLGVCWLYLISSVFTLAKTLRDAHEAALADARARRDAGDDTAA